MYKVFLVFTLLFAAGNCEKTQASDHETRTVYIGSTLEDCMGLAPQKCMMYRESPQEEWTFFYDLIKGFEYQEGYQYQLRVKITPVAVPMADASSVIYELIEIIAKEKVPPKAPEESSAAAIQDPSFKAVAYEEYSRGFYKRIEVTAKQIGLFKDRDGDAEKTLECTKSLWSEMQTMALATNPTTINELTPPSTGFRSDRSAHAALIIKTTDSTYTSCTFDSGNPPAKIKAIVSKIISLED